MYKIIPYSLSNMTTEMISISEYRKNISLFTKRASEQNICFIVTSHGKPVGEYRPMTSDNIVIQRKFNQSFLEEMTRAESEPNL